MDLERLTKSQFVLLTLLISFVTSIATGIVTVALMEQAPPAITQTVNRVVERTIEKVSPATQTASAAASMPETVVIRESDLLASAIELVSPSIVRLFMPGKDEAGKEIALFIGLALVSDANGILIADAATPDGKITALRSDGKEVSVTVIARPKDANMIRLQAATSSAEGPLSWKPAVLSTKIPALGSAVVAIGGRTTTRVAKGIIIGSSESEGDTTGGLVETDIHADSFAAGSPLIDSDGAIIAIATRGSRIAATGGFLASSSIMLQNKETEGGQGGTAAP